MTSTARLAEDRAAVAISKRSESETMRLILGPDRCSRMPVESFTHDLSSRSSRLRTWLRSFTAGAALWLHSAPPLW